MNQSYTTWRNYLLNTDIPFSDKAWTVYRHQLEHQPVYRRFCDELSGSDAGNGDHRADSTSETIPLIPIQTFRDTLVRADYMDVPQAVFRSSGTAGMKQSTHEIADIRLYFDSCYRGFSQFYDPREFVLLSWLPGYLDNPESSLVAMIDHLVQRDVTGQSRFLSLDQPLDGVDLSTVSNMNTVKYLNKRRHRRSSGLPDVTGKDGETPAKKRRIMLFGAAFGLLDLIDAGAPKLPADALVVETGGMKTRRRELSKEELRQRLAEGFGLPPGSIHSEYGMAEMCSQAWDTGKGSFRCPPWLRITVRDPENPTQELAPGEEGLIGVMDLANVHSLAFFLTQDRGVLLPDGSFQVMGRWDHAELRGCNFLTE